MSLLVADLSGTSLVRAPSTGMHALLDATGGELHGDATALGVDWHGEAEDDCHAPAGAER